MTAQHFNTCSTKHLDRGDRTLAFQLSKHLKRTTWNLKWLILRQFIYSVQGMNDIFDTGHRQKLKDVSKSSNRL